MDLKEMGLGEDCVDWIALSEGRNKCEHGNVHSVSRKCWEFLDELRKY